MRWDEESLQYDDFHHGNWGYIYEEVIARVSASAPPGARIVEMGCGTGIITLGITHCAAQINGYDISEKMLAVARSKATEQGVENVEFMLGDAYQLPEENATFDLVLCCFLLDVVEQPEVVLSQAHRLLVQNGTLISITDCYQDTGPVTRVRVILREVMSGIRSFLYATGLRKRPLHRPRDTQLMRLTNDAGFRIVETSILDVGEPDHFNLLMTAKKF